MHRKKNYYYEKSVGRIDKVGGWYNFRTKD